MEAIITAAGLGTRMLPASKEIPKEMFPVPFRGSFKPVIQIIFEQFYDFGVRDFVMVVGRGKRVIEDHFTPDYDFVYYLEGLGKGRQARELEEFYGKIERSNIAFVNQSSPEGFGDAVLRAKPFVHSDFVVAAADTIIDGLPNMVVNSFLVTWVSNPRPYGVVSLDGDRVVSVEEKPVDPKSNWIIVPYYHFDYRVFDALEFVRRGRGNSKVEVQLTDAIKYLIDGGVDFRAIKVDRMYDLGNVENYISSLKLILQSSESFVV
ncbi:sugar phosphate nucleotidyltransferase [Acidianus manzaensis]|uniref:UTP--glucose-1-phosphate uridylyltransferase n=1 Tax=Acidianus manzaensis TaxID=282676 RepID=A0A1W6JWP0_9CREN|nr:sugar phosphate nucleotidyltransferase [Acidianus manzaensis]ARM74634.1 UTP--glucose-1-phosphate uridylyltransferase [Acidianus manzaensis]